MMNDKQLQTLVSGFIATGVISGFYYLINSLGLDVLAPWNVIRYMFNVSLGFAWLLHFCVGQILTWAYRSIFSLGLRKIKNLLLRGLCYGFIVFLISEVIVGIIDFNLNADYEYRIVPMSMLLIGGVLYGLVIGLMVPPRNVHYKKV